MENTAIEWATHTFNPWIGCTKVSPGCDNCYAEFNSDLRYGQVKWGKGQPRRRVSEAGWANPVKWNAEVKAGEIVRVFCASEGDVFDPEVEAQWRKDLFALIRATPKLAWLLLTKRHSQAVQYYEKHGCPQMLGLARASRIRNGRTNVCLRSKRSQPRCAFFPWSPCWNR